MSDGLRDAERPFGSQKGLEQEPKPERAVKVVKKPTEVYAPVFMKDGDEYVVPTLAGFGDAATAEAAGASARLHGLVYAGRVIGCPAEGPAGPYLEARVADLAVWIVGGPTLDALITSRSPALKNLG